MSQQSYWHVKTSFFFIFYFIVFSFLFFSFFKIKFKSSLFLNIRNKRFGQSSPVQPNPENFFFSLKISKNHFFKTKKLLLKKFFLEKREKKNAILLVFNIRRTRFDQSPPVQPISDFRGGGGPLSLTKDGWKSSCRILDV